MKPTSIRLILALILGLVAATQSTGAQAMSAEEIMERSQHAFHYMGGDAKGKLTMELIDRDGGKRVRVLTMLRRNQGDGGEQKYFMYFHEPGDVRRLTFMVWKYPGRDDDRWIFIPSVDLIRRIAVEDKYSSFVGSDFSYEDVSGRDVSEDRHALVREEMLGGRDTYVIESVPREAAPYSKRISWIDKENFLPLKEEYYDARNELHRVSTAENIKDIAAADGKGGPYPTPMKRTMKNVQTGHSTVVTVSAVSYGIGLKDADFSERRMRRPPRSWTR